jgi:carbonic anhydrase
MMDLDAEIDMVHHDLSLAKSQLAVISATGTERQISGATEVKMTAEKLLARKMAEKAELTAQIVTTENAVLSQQIEVSAHVPAQKFLPNKVGVNASTGAEIYQEVLDAAQKVEDVHTKINAAKAREQSALKNAASDRLTAVAASNAKQAAEVAKAEGMMLSLDLKKAEERLKLITSESKNAQEMIFVGSIKESVRNIIKEAVLRNEAIRGPAYASPLEKYHPSATRTPLSIKFEKMLVNLHFIRKIRTGKAAVSVLWVQSHRKKFEDALRTDMSYALEISKDNILINYISAAETKMPKKGLGGGTVVDVTILGGLPADVSVVDNQFTWREVNAVYGMPVEATVWSTKVVNPGANTTDYELASVVKKKLTQAVQAQQSHDEGSCTYCKSGEDWTGMCEVGNVQSPIDIPADIAMGTGTGDRPVFHFGSSRHRVMNDGATIVSECATCTTGYAWVLLGNQRYTARKAIFHSPSEHTVAGQSFPLEMQMQFEPDNGEDKITTLSILFREGEENKVLTKMEVHRLPAVGEPSYVMLNKVNFSNFISSEDTLVSYDGSTTQQPCTENNHWFIKQKALTLSKDQIVFFRRNFAGDKKFAEGRGNNRAVKPLSGRTLNVM